MSADEREAENTGISFGQMSGQTGQAQVSPQSLVQDSGALELQAIDLPAAVLYGSENVHDDLPYAPESSSQYGHGMQYASPAIADEKFDIGLLSTGSGVELLIALWPYGLREEQIKGLNVSTTVRQLDSQFVALAFGFGFALLSVVLASSFFGPISLCILPVCLLVPAFAGSYLLKEPAYIKLYKYGFVIQWMYFGKVVQQTQVFWKMVERIYLEDSRPEEGEFWKSDKPKVIFETMDGVTIQLNLEAFPSAEDWQKFLQAAQHWGGLSNVTVDPNITAAFSKEDAEDNYTQLWLETLNAAPERQRLQPLDEGTQLDTMRYEIVRRIGTGGQGTAYLANDLHVGKQVVLKEYILPVYVDVTTRKLALESLQHEVMILKSLHHSNIAQFTGFFVEDHRAYLVEEYLSGSSLRTLIQENGPPSLLVAVRMSLTMTEMLAYLHNRTPKVIHRDFTPDNLIYDDKGVLKLIDFTVAQQGDDAEVSMAVGKQCYLPPEQFRGRATTQSDIYAMGATMYFLVTGEDPEPLSQSQVKGRDGEIYDALNFVLARATALELDQRYMCVEEAREELLLIEQFLIDQASGEKGKAV